MSHCNTDSSFPTNPILSFQKAKTLARNKVYYDYSYTFYCNCSFTALGASGGKVNFEECGYQFRRDQARASKIEWEHIVPASIIGLNRKCWTAGHEMCVKKGRTCCDKTDNEYNIAANDLHNLVPEIGELNADRINYQFGVIDGEPRKYGNCDFEIKDKVVEPADKIKGDIARISLYMHSTYNLPISDAQAAMFNSWHIEDPVDAWEITRDSRICEIQGNSNHYVNPIGSCISVPEELCAA